MRVSFLLGVAVGATLMYLFDPRQGPERREIWGERVRKGSEQAQSAVKTGRERVQEYRRRGDDLEPPVSSPVASNGETADA
jgi:gas vesicle protein